MNYIVLDLEWNQGSGSSSSAANLLFEIIEIGAVKYNQDFKKIGTYQKLIKPKVHKKIHPIITNITGLTDRDFSYEKDFKYVIKEFLRWCGQDYVFCTFGTQDLYELQCNAEYNGVELPFTYPMKYIDVQRIFSIEHPEIHEQKSLESLVKFYSIKQNKIYHRALGDALYTGEVLKCLNIDEFFKYMSLDYYTHPETEKEALDIDLGSHKEYISILYDSKDELLKSTQIYITRCLECGKKCRKKTKWFSDTSKYLCIAKCETHGYIEGQLVIKKQHNTDKYFAVRKVFMIDEEKKSYVEARKEAIKEKRRLKRQK